jgi:hypothetical protein
MNIRQGNREIKRDFRSNTVSGEPKHCGPSKELGAAYVAKCMLKAEAPQHNSSGGRGVKFEIGDKNLAKKIDHDAEPR